MKRAKENIAYDSKNNFDSIDYTVAELYALRAGLSIISQQADSVREHEAEISNQEKRVADSNSQADAISKKIADEEKNLQKCKDSLKDKIKKYYDDFDKEKNRKASLAVKGWTCCIFILGLCFFLPFLIDDDTPVVFMIVGIALVICSLLIPVVYVFVRKRENKNRQLALEMQIKLETDKNKKECEEIQKLIDNLRCDGTKYSKIKNDLYDETQANIDVINTDINNIVRDITVYNNTLEKTYSKLLNPADWKNIDLCIFYLQTGRSDTIKESLQLVDRQRQTDEIVRAIDAASDRICTEIRGGFAALGSTMVTCLNALSYQMEVVSNTLSSQHAETVRALGTIEENSAKVLSATQLNNALLEKANTSSERLLNDYKYVQSKYGINV